MGQGGLADDARKLGVYKEREERRRDFASAVGDMWEEDFSYDAFPAEPPRVTGWWLRDLRRDGVTPKRAHGIWVSETNISTKDRSYLEHELLVDALGALCVV